MFFHVSHDHVNVTQCMTYFIMMYGSYDDHNNF